MQYLLGTRGAFGNACLVHGILDSWVLVQADISKELRFLLSRVAKGMRKLGQVRQQISRDASCCRSLLKAYLSRQIAQRCMVQQMHFLQYASGNQV